MPAHGLAIKPRRRFVCTTDCDHDLPIFPNLYRNITPAKPNIVSVTDITCSRIIAGLCFLAAIHDACGRKVVGYARSTQIDTQLTSAASRATLRNRQPLPGTCIHHSDRGRQCASDAYRHQPHKVGLLGSMGGRPILTTLPRAESFMKTLKVEEVYLAGYDLCRRDGTPSPVYQRGLQNPAHALCARLSVTRRIRGTTRPARSLNSTTTMVQSPEFTPRRRRIWCCY
jgi:putative transposase